MSAVLKLDGMPQSVPPVLDWQPQWALWPLVRATRLRKIGRAHV